MAHDVIIVGGGLAGLFCALKLAPRPVTLVTAAPFGSGAASGWAQGGIAAAVGEGDSPQAHADDTVAAGAGLGDAELALVMAREGPERLIELMAYGVPFDHDADGHLMLSREAAHSARRIARVRGDQAGREIMRALVARTKETPSISVLNGFSVEDLVMRGRRVVGLRARVDDRMVTLPASAVVLATGGVGGLYAVTTNPPEARGAGLAIAARAGARIADPEFVQFHPTAIATGRDPAPLATEALRGEGATLVNNRGERFMTHVHPDAELAPRDIVARAVFAEIAAGRNAYLDARTAIGAAFPDKFPGVYASCMAAGIDPTTKLIPIALAAHYHMGGIAVDAQAHTSLDGLWAIGEVACTGVHGANRLASNSLLEAVVFAARAAAQIGSLPAGRDLPPLDTEPTPPLAPTAARERRLRALMSANVGVVRNEGGLSTALAEIARMEREAPTPAFRNMATAALLIAAAALARRESRGAHFRSDFPKADASRAYRTLTTLADARDAAEKISASAPAS